MTPRASLLVVALGWLILISCGSRTVTVSNQYGPLVERWETSNNTVTIRVSNFRERDPVFLHHFFYVFECAPKGTDRWREVISLRQNDDRPIPRDQVHFLNNEIVYLFMNSKFAVTTDQGTTWFVWDATNELKDWHQSYLYIQEVRLDVEGNGTLKLLPFPDKVAAPVFSTKDFGRHWSLSQ
jgi:hypothetical protein